MKLKVVSIFIVLFTSLNYLCYAGQGRPISGPQLEGNSIPKTEDLQRLVRANHADKVTRKCMAEAVQNLFAQTPLELDGNCDSLEYHRYSSRFEYFNPEAENFISYISGEGEYSDLILHSLDTCGNLPDLNFRRPFDDETNKFRHIEVIFHVPNDVNPKVTDGVFLEANTYYPGAKNYQNFKIPYLKYDRLFYSEVDIYGRKIKKISSLARLVLNDSYSMEELENGNVPPVKLYNNGIKSNITFDLAAYNLCLIDEISNPANYEENE